MRTLLLLLLKAYWRLVPMAKRHRCLFKKSCSQFVYDHTHKTGFKKGLKAMRYRHKHCRPGYYIIHGKNGKLFISARNGVFDCSEIDAAVLKEGGL